jgi:hypothetical protein
MSSLMQDVRTLGFEQAKEKSVLDTKDTFKTYCELRNDRCVFLIHVPEMRRFTDEAQDSLGMDAWKSAQAVLHHKGAGKDGMKLAVGMMGLVSYDRVMMGRYSSDTNNLENGPEQIARGFGSERPLYEWFAPEKTNAQPPHASP